MKREAPIVNREGDSLDTIHASRLLPPAVEQKALARADLARLYTNKVNAAPRGMKVQARERFVAAFNTGLLRPDLYALLGAVSWQSVERWAATVRKSGDALELADRRGTRVKSGPGVSPEAGQVLLACVLQPNAPLVSEAIRTALDVMAARGIADGLSDATYRRWLKNWISENYDAWCWHRGGDKRLEDNCSPSILRDYGDIEVGDILVADGHTLNFECLNPWTGKPKRMTLILWYDMASNYPVGWDIMPTENTGAIAAALRRAILRLGFAPRVAYLDNGRAFRSRFFAGVDLESAGLAGLFERLGIKPIYAWPYHGQSKTIERFFGTLAELERLCPTYTGTDIEHKPPRMNRGEKLHRRLWEKRMGDWKLTIEGAHAALAHWFDEYARRPQAGHLDGRTPLEVFAERRTLAEPLDYARLTEMMLAVKVRTIYRNGIKFLGRDYWHPNLYGKKHAVTVRYDLQDTGSVLVYHEDGSFLCEARPWELCHPAASALGDEEDRARLAEKIELKKGLVKQTTGPARAFLDQVVLPEYRRQLGAAGIGGEVIPIRNAERGTRSAERPEEIEARAAAIVVERDPDALWEELPGLADEERYEKLLQYEAAGRDLPPDEKTFMRYFEEGDYFQSHRVYYDAARLRFSLAAGS